jgi:hypothetical protein
MKRVVVVVATLLIPSAAGAAPAIEWEGRYVNQHIPFAGRSFQYTSGRTQRKIDGSEFGLGMASMHGGEMSFFGRGDRWAFGPMVGFAMASAPTSKWSGATMHAFHVNVGFESRYTFSSDRWTGWVGGVVGLAITNVASGPETQVPTVREYPRSASRLDLLLQPRVGFEYAFSQGPIGRCAFGGWMGVDPLQGAYAVGLLISTRLNLMSGQGTTTYYF